jgi:hypothetical protein
MSMADDPSRSDAVTTYGRRAVAADGGLREDTADHRQRTLDTLFVSRW